MKKRIWAISIAFMLLAGLLSGCADTPRNNSGNNGADNSAVTTDMQNGTQTENVIGTVTGDGVITVSGGQVKGTPYAKGLFHKGIVQSGATEIMGVSFSSKEISERIGELTLQNLGISPENVEDIQTVSLNNLLDASDKAREQTGREYGMYLSLSTDYGIEWGPVIDGDYMPTAPVTEDSFAEAGKDIPLLIGSNFTEWTHWMSMSMHSNMTAEQIAAFEEAYPMRKSSDAPYVDSFIRLPMLKIMSHKVDQGGAPVYAYVFNYGNDPYHGTEISYVFGNGRGDLGRQMSSAWANFARNGVPSADGLPEWEPYTRGS